MVLTIAFTTGSAVSGTTRVDSGKHVFTKSGSHILKKPVYLGLTFLAFLQASVCNASG